MKKSFRKCLLIFICIFLSSCAAPFEEVGIEVEMPEKLGNSELSSEAIPQRWWEEFNQEQLNSLIETAISNNLTIAQLAQRVEQAQAAATIAGADIYPSLDITAGASRAKGRSQTTNQSNYTSLYSTGLVVGYEVDIWGKVRANADAGVYEWAATQQDFEAAKISIAAQVADTWFALAERIGQIKLLDEQIELNDQSLELVTMQFRQGHANAEDVLQQKQLLEANIGEKELVEATADVLRNQIAILTGKSPGTIVLPEPTAIPSIKKMPDAGSSKQLIERRPDIKAAYLQVQAADRNVAAAVAARMPSVNLSSRLTTSDDQIKGLFENWQANIAADLLMPVFDAGRRKAEIDRQEAIKQQAIYGYIDTVINSIGEVRDALALEQRQHRYIESLRKQITLSKQSVNQIRENYTKGAADYLRFLAAQNSDQSLERQYLSAKKELISYRISLYKALAGKIEQVQTK